MLLLKKKFSSDAILLNAVKEPDSIVERLCLSEFVDNDFRLLARSLNL